MSRSTQFRQPPTASLRSGSPRLPFSRRSDFEAWLLRTGLSCVMSWGMVAASLNAAPPKPSPAEIQLWIDGLRSNQVAIREWASQKLVESGADVIDPLADSIAKMDLESTLRGLDVLRTLALNELATSSQAENAIRELAANRAAASSVRAEEILQSIASSRTQRAEKILHRLGVDFSVTSISSFSYSYTSPVVKTLSFGERWSGSIDDLAFLNWLSEYRELTIEAHGPDITDEWLRAVSQVENVVGLKLGRSHVTDEGMAVIQDMPRLRDLRIHYCDISDAWLKYLDTDESGLRSLSVFGSRITEAAMKQLSEHRPQLMTRFGVGGFLGIRGEKNPNGTGCLVTEVTANAAASKADIRPRDLIVAYNGQSVTEFVPLQLRLQNSTPVFPPEEDAEETDPKLSLSELIGQNAPGDKVRIEIKRGGRTILKEVLLGEWP